MSGETVDRAAAALAAFEGVDAKDIAELDPGALSAVIDYARSCSCKCELCTKIRSEAVRNLYAKARGETKEEP